MPGIRINTPVGQGWEYSLDAQTWQASPKFLQLPGGAAFVKGTEYRIFCKHSASGRATIATIPFGQATSDKTLDSFLDYPARRNLLLTGQGNFITRQSAGEAPADRGHFHQVQGADGSLALQAFLGYLATGVIRLSLGSGQVLELKSDGVFISAPKLDASSSLGSFLNLAVINPPTAKATDSDFRARWNPVSKQWEATLAGPADITNDIVQNANPLTIAQWLAPYQQGSSTNSNPFAVGVIKCYDLPTEVSDVISKPFKITAGMIGVPQAHGLATPGANLIPLLLDANNKPDTVMDITFPDNDHFLIAYPDSSVTDYAGGKLLLTTVPS